MILMNSYLEGKEAKAPKKDDYYRKQISSSKDAFIIDLGNTHLFKILHSHLQLVYNQTVVDICHIS